MEVIMAKNKKVREIRKEIAIVHMLPYVH